MEKEGNHRAYGTCSLDANVYNWCYRNIRRLCIMAEQTLAEAIRAFMFELNKRATWSRIRTVSDNFYCSLWLVGIIKRIKPLEAYFVKLGLGETMIASDRVNGRMKQVTGMAEIKPAEFIIPGVIQKMKTS